MNGINRWRRAARRCLTVLLALGLLAGAAMGDGRGDLSERFADVPRVVYGSETYYLRGRLSSVMVAGLLPDESDGMPRADFMAIFVIDDNEKRITPIYLDGMIAVEVRGGSLPLRAVCALGQDPMEGCAQLREVVNGLLGGDLIGSCLGIDLDGITAVDGFGGIEGGARERLRQLHLLLQNIPSNQLNEMYGEISDYLITDLKSGAVMRMLDKAERYEIAEAAELPTLPAEELLIPDRDGILELVIGVFCEAELL